MHTNRRSRRSRPVGPLAVVVLAALLGGMVAGVPRAQDRPGQGTLPWKPAPGSEDLYLGVETCAICHDEVAQQFSVNIHAGRTDRLGHPAGDLTCESCHGPGNDHVEAGGDPEAVVNRFLVASAESVARSCLVCHAGAAEHAHDLTSPHLAAEVGCTSCHAVHQPPESQGLLKAVTPELCITCHRETAADFTGPEGHRLHRGIISCESCHSPHGSSEPTLLRRPMMGGDLCASCHIDKRGPYVYEHAAGTVEGCVACHTPHGSPNRFLLKTSDTATLCVSCHIEAPVVHDLSNPRFRTCTTCHTAIHGSDTHPLFFRR